MLEQGSSIGRKEGVAQTKSYELTPTPVSHLPVTLVEERRWQKSQEQRVELSLGKKRNLVLLFLFLFLAVLF